MLDWNSSMITNSNIQLVVADIDGTFLDSENRISAGALEAVYEIRQQGIEFTFSSGRGNSGIKPLVKLLNLNQPYISSAGAAILCPDGETIIRQELLCEKQIETAVNFGKSANCEVLLHSACHMFALVSDPFWEDICTWEWLKGYGLQEMQRIADWRSAPVDKIIRLDIFGNDKDLPILNQAVNDLGVGLHSIQMRHNLEIMDQCVNKGSALRHLSEYLHIPMVNILALGDGMNDASMLESAGIGFAMHNSNMHVKNKANYVAPSNDQGGFAWVLRNLLSGKIVEFSWTE